MAEGDDQTEQRRRRLGAAQDAVDRFRATAVWSGPSFRPALAAALSQLAALQNKSGALREAERTAEEAVAVYRQLASEDPAAFEVGLGEALGRLGEALWRQRRPQPALAALSEAVSVLDEAHETDPGRAARPLAEALRLLAERLPHEPGQRRATELFRRAIDTLRGAAGDHRRGSALLLADLAQRLLADATTPVEAGLSTAGEAVGLLRQLVGGGDATLAPALVRALLTLSRLAERGQAGDLARQAADDAIVAARGLAAGWPQIQGALLAESLTLAARLGFAGPIRRLLAEEALDLWRAEPAPPPSGLAEALLVLALAAEECNDHARADALKGEAAVHLSGPAPPPAWLRPLLSPRRQGSEP